MLHWAQPNSTFGEGLSKDEIQSAHMEKDSRDRTLQRQRRFIIFQNGAQVPATDNWHIFADIVLILKEMSVIWQPQFLYFKFQGFGN